MCICLNCNRFSNCKIVSDIEQKHREHNRLKENKKILFFPQSPILICLNFFFRKSLYLFEWDINECLSYEEKVGAWLLPDKKTLRSSSYLLFDSSFN
uniref:hypothetical protein n=1 Tax=Analipus japonicus TaxID=31333 RepID=UPI002E77B4F1|nr:hypothetical protein V2471_pgp063 [Analipus japonicus]WAM61934.1 hypothetical protein [Analipus japonicus]